MDVRPIADLRNLVVQQEAGRLMWSHRGGRRGVTGGKMRKAVRCGTSFGLIVGSSRRWLPPGEGGTLGQEWEKKTQVLFERSKSRVEQAHTLIHFVAFSSNLSNLAHTCQSLRHPLFPAREWGQAQLSTWRSPSMRALIMMSQSNLDPSSPQGRY